MARRTNLPQRHPDWLALAAGVVIFCLTILSLSVLASQCEPVHAVQDPTPNPPPLPEPTPRPEADDINTIIDGAIAQVARPRNMLIYSERARYEAAAWALAYQASSCGLDWRFQPEIDRCCEALAQFAPEFIPYAPPCWR